MYNMFAISSWRKLYRIPQELRMSVNTMVRHLNCELNMQHKIYFRYIEEHLRKNLILI